MTLLVTVTLYIAQNNSNDMTRLDDAMLERLEQIVTSEYRPFSYRDFLHFEINGSEHRMCHGTFRNKISKLRKKNQVEVAVPFSSDILYLKGPQIWKADDT